MVKTPMGRPASEIIERDSRLFMRCYPARTKLVITRGRGAEVWDAEGRKYLDLFSGIAVNNVGHCHPRVVEAIRRQSEELMHTSMLYYNETVLRLAEKLAGIVPRGLSRFFFANSGAEAVEGAVKLAKKYAAKRGMGGAQVIALDCSFHGRTSLALTLTGQKKYKQGLGNFANAPGVVHAPSPYCYRCPLGLRYPECGVACADALERVFEFRTSGEVAAVIVEPVQGEGGIIVPPDEYLPRVQNICREHGAAFIVDEVQTGLGRTGKIFAAEHWGLEPDIMTMAKALGGGLPIGAIAAREEVANAFEPGDHFSTFGGNPVSCAAAIAAIDVLLDEKLHERAERLGNLLLKMFRDAQSEAELIGDVRGKGLMIGIELVKDKESKQPASDEANKTSEEALKKGIIIGVGGVRKNVIRIQPPLVVTEEQAQRAAEEIIAIIKQIRK